MYEMYKSGERRKIDVLFLSLEYIYCNYWAITLLNEKAHIFGAHTDNCEKFSNQMPHVIK